jgi:hypothetical protein
MTERVGEQRVPPARCTPLREWRTRDTEQSADDRPARAAGVASRELRWERVTGLELGET